jgi:hypothetical protein
MPAKSISTKLTSSIGQRSGKRAMQRYTPEIMLGINKNLMVHGATTFSNMHTGNVAWESVYIYGKYRFFSKDDVHSHFRMAAFAEGGYSKNPILYDELNVQGDVSGLQAGLIATQLQNKLAVSGTVSYIKALYDEAKVHHTNVVDNAMNYTLSAGYLVLPREYTSYNQLNFNIYTEFLAQHAIGDGKTYFIDAAPAIQFIFNSNSKLNLGYRFQVKGNANRSMQKSFLVSFEHTFFNVLRKKKS